MSNIAKLADWFTFAASGALGLDYIFMLPTIKWLNHPRCATISVMLLEERSSDMGSAPQQQPAAS